jgi:hypothetical protein
MSFDRVCWALIKNPDPWESFNGLMVSQLRNCTVLAGMWCRAPMIGFFHLCRQSSIMAVQAQQPRD